MTEGGPRILVVEDHAALGRFIGAALATAGWVVVGPFNEYASAMDAARRTPLDLAVLDRLLGGEETFAILDVLFERGVGCLLISGHPREALPERYRDFPFLLKPFTMSALLGALRALAGETG
jgi:DNA-binding response OmpR family regulator